MVLILSACSTPQERAARAAAERERLKKMFETACTNYGFEKSTPEFNQCVSNEKRRRETERKVRAAAIRASQAAYAAEQAQQKANQIDNNLTWSCINSGGVRVGNTCMK